VPEDRQASENRSAIRQVATAPAIDPNALHSVCQYLITSHDLIGLALHHLTCNFDVFLTSHEHKNIAGRETEMDLEDLLDGRVNVIFARAFGVEGLDRERSTRDGEAWCRAIEIAELLGVHRRGRHD
jgi:hypothetical protein